MNDVSHRSERGIESLPADEQVRLSQILDEYLGAFERGVSISPDDLLAAHPDLAGPILDCLASLNLLRHAAVELGVQPKPAFSPVDLPERTLGDYRLLREIGRGGMGIVYEARQISLGRTVAVKVLPFAAVLDQKQIARFQNEAQAAAQLQHPHIVPVFAVGCERGVHYYSMPFIDGQSLDRAIRDSWDRLPDCRDSANDKLEVCSTSNTDRLVAGSHATVRSVRTRNYVKSIVELAIQAADALHHAHESGVIHRDVKPSNLMVDRQGKLWITDFGLARCATSSNVTLTGDVFGTLRYMSPEQAAGKTHLVDHRSDIYSLGMTLFELLALRPAFDGDDRIDILRRIQDEPLPSLRAANSAVPFDLETIVLKATAKSRDDRYASAADFGADLQRLLDGQPTRARRPTLLDRSSKWLARHRVATAASLAVLLLAFVGVSIAAVMLARKQTETDAALAKAHAHFREVQTAVDRFGAGVSEQLRDVTGAEPIRKQLLRETLQYYQAFLAYAGDDPTLRVDAAKAAFKAGAVCEQLGETAEAIRLYRQSLAEFARLKPSNAADSAQCQNQLGALLAKSGDVAAGERELRAALDTQRRLVTDHSNEPRFQTDLTATQINLGMVLAETGRTDSAERMYRAALQPEASARSTPHRAVALHNLSGLISETDPREAERLAVDAVATHRELAARAPMSAGAQADLALALANLGSLQNRNGHVERAVATLRDAMAIQERLVYDSPSVVAFRADLAASRNNLGQALLELHDFAVAEMELHAAREQFARLAAEFPDDSRHGSSLANVLNNLGLAFERQRRFEEAAASLEQAVAVQETAVARAPQVARYRELLDRHAANLRRVLERRGENKREDRIRG